MGKLKTHSGAKKRFKKTATGKVVFKKPTSNHFLQKKSASRKRKFRGNVSLSGLDKARMAKKIK